MWVCWWVGWIQKLNTIGPLTTTLQKLGLHPPLVLIQIIDNNNIAILVSFQQQI